MRVNHANTMRRRNDKIKKNAKKKNVINDLHIKVRWFSLFKVVFNNGFQVCITILRYEIKSFKRYKTYTDFS